MGVRGFRQVFVWSFHLSAFVLKRPALLALERQSQEMRFFSSPKTTSVGRLFEGETQALNPLSAIWRIYPSSKWSSQWPYDGYIRHGWMTSCGRGRGSATSECFGRGSQGTIFVRSSKLSLFFPELCSFRRVFLFPALLQNLAPNVRALRLLVSTMSWSSFWKLRSVTRHFLANSDYDHEYFLKVSFLFSKQRRCYLPDSYGDPQAEQSSLVLVRQKLEWKRDFRALARSSAEGPSIVVAFSKSLLRWSMVQKRQKPDEVSRLWLPFIVYKNQRGNQRVLRSLFPRPEVSTVLLFAVFL